ncbi:MAG: response regulator [Nitrospiraceae bacterium]|nr:response regulator [Nitrospiraceae bacterium]
MKKAKILIVESESVTAMSIAHYLELWGYDVCEYVSTGEDALRVAERERPDLALLNIKLRGEMKGLELSTRLGKCFGIPVVFISGYTGCAVRKQAEEAGAAGYLAKPFDFALLRSILEQALFQKTK